VIVTGDSGIVTSGSGSVTSDSGIVTRRFSRRMLLKTGPARRDAAEGKETIHLNGNQNHYSTHESCCAVATAQHMPVKPPK
jgi:hypothetical protein